MKVIRFAILAIPARTGLAVSILFALASILVISRPASAHHSFVGFYDQTRTVEIEGIVTSVSWRNPHGTITLNVDEDSGETVEWTVETGSISVLRVRGIDPDFLAVGDRVRVAGEPALRRPAGIYARNMLLENGAEALLSIGVTPHFTDAESGRLLTSADNPPASDMARREANGIFRVWSTVFEDPNSFPLFKGNYPLTESARVAKSEWDASNIVQLGCEPKGMPSLMITPYPIEFTALGDDILLKFEEDNAERVIHMAAAAAHPGETSLLGYSTGRWEGKTLVVETAGVSALYLDYDGTPQSPDARFVERFTPSDDETRLDYRITITDPATFTDTFDLARYFVWRPELRVNNYDCVVPDA